MEKEDYCSFELSKKLKAAGFDLPTHTFYSKRGGFAACTRPENHNGTNENFAAPTIGTVRKWLREVKHLHVQVMLNGVHTLYFARVLEINGILNICEGKTYETYEAALEAGIKAAVGIVVKQFERGKE